MSAYLKISTILASALIVTSCSSLRSPLSAHLAAPSIDLHYIDLQPGWRLRVVTPILKSGGYRVASSSTTYAGHEVTVTSDGDFLGYETAYYRIVHASGHRLKIQLQSAIVRKDGKSFPTREPIANRIAYPQLFRFVRMLYLTRLSGEDHDTMLVAANTDTDLQQITSQLIVGTTNCRTATNSTCAVVPQGISILPEVRSKIDGVIQWTPAQTE